MKNREKQIAHARALHEQGYTPQDLRDAGFGEAAIQAVLREAVGEVYRPITCGEH